MVNTGLQGHDVALHYWLVHSISKEWIAFMEVNGAKKNAKTGDGTGPLTQRCSITSLKIGRIVTCPCLHGQFTEGQK